MVLLYTIDAVCRHAAPHVSGPGTVGPGGRPKFPGGNQRTLKVGAPKGKGSDSGAEPFGHRRRTVDCYTADPMDHDRVRLEGHVLFLWDFGPPVGWRLAALQH